MSDEEIIRTLEVSKSIARDLNLEIVIGTRFNVMRGQQQLYVTETIHGVHGFLVGWSVARDDLKPRE